MPTSPFLTKLRTDAMVAGRESAHAAPTAYRHLVAVDDLPPVVVLTLPSLAAADLSVHSVRFDRQGRASTRQLLSELAWDATTRLSVEVDRGAQVLWLRDAEAVGARGEGPVTCACEGCAHPIPLPTLPGATRVAVETVRVDAKWQLCLTPGLRQAIGVTGAVGQPADPRGGGRGCAQRTSSAPTGRRAGGEASSGRQRLRHPDERGASVMDDRILEWADDLKHTADRKGLDLEALIAALQDQSSAAAPAAPEGGANGSGPTIAEYVPVVVRSLSGRKTETRRTYRTALRLLADGFALEDHVYARNGGEARSKPWPDDRVARWLHHARRISREWDFAVDRRPATAPCAPTSAPCATRSSSPPATDYCRRTRTQPAPCRSRGRRPTPATRSPKPRSRSDDGGGEVRTPAVVLAVGGRPSDGWDICVEASTFQRRADALALRAGHQGRRRRRGGNDERRTRPEPTLTMSLRRSSTSRRRSRACRSRAAERW